MVVVWQVAMSTTTTLGVTLSSNREPLGVQAWPVGKLAIGDACVL